MVIGAEAMTRSDEGGKGSLGVKRRIRMRGGSEGGK